MTKAEGSALDRFAYGAAEQYVQSVVLVDDRIYEARVGSTPSRVRKPDMARRKAALKSASIPANGGTESAVSEIADQGASEVSFHDVQNSFAKKRIICSLYQPKAGALFGSRSEVYKLCSTADVVIVDWDLHGDLGKNATQLIGGLVEQSQLEMPQQLRLVLVYTREPNLHDIADRVFGDLTTRLGKDGVSAEEASGGLALETEFARVVVLGKLRNENLKQFERYYVPENELADRTIREFAQLSSGLLQGIALQGMAQLRQNNRRILARFRKDLDIAFLAHRALTLADEDPLEHIACLLADELRAVLEDALGDSPLGGNGAERNRILRAWCKDNWEEASKPAIEIDKGVSPAEFAEGVVCDGPLSISSFPEKKGSQIHALVKVDEATDPIWKNKKQRKKLAEYLLGKNWQEESHERLAALMCQRMLYRRSDRRLYLGSVVREVDSQKRYLLCLQPMCDSVRLRGRRRPFVFCSLAEAGQGEDFTHCLCDPEGALLRLKYKPTVDCLLTADFKSPKAARTNEGRFVFSDADGKEYEWVAQLKSEHAQHAAEQFGNKLTRVGLVQSEWMRLKIEDA